MAAATAATALPARAAYNVAGLKSTNKRAAAASRTTRTATRAAIADPPAGRNFAGSQDDDVPPTKGTGRKKVVVLGSGWGAISFVKSLQGGTQLCTAVQVKSSCDSP
jgi:NADH:ubiquinone reductase (non-electrogenic)